MITADSATFNIGRDLTIVSQVDRVEGSNSSKGFNASLSFGLFGTGSGASAGIKGGKGSESKVWVAGVSGILTDNSLDVQVRRGTQITGGVIASYSNDLTFSTETLSTKDIALHDNKRQLDGSLGVNVGVNAQGVSKPGVTVEGKYANHEVKGIAKATIGEGKVEVRSQTAKQTEIQLAAINRDPDSVIEVTSVKDEGFELYISDTAISGAIELAKTVGEALRKVGAVLASRNDMSAKDVASGLAVYKALSEQGINPEALRQCAGRQGSNQWNIWEWIVPSAHAGNICSNLVAQFGNSAIQSCLKILDAAKLGASSMVAAGIERVLAAYERDPKTGDALLLLRDGAVGIAIEVALDNKQKAELDRMGRAGGALLENYINDLVAKVANGRLDKEEAIAMATGATLVALILVPRRLRSKLIASIKKPLSKLTKRFRAPNRTVSFDPKQIQKKYTKHAEDFGVTGNYNKANAEKFQSAVDAHIKSPDVKPITGTYRGDPVTHYVDPKTGLNAMKDPSGNFISSWKLNPAQLKNVIERGKL